MYLRKFVQFFLYKRDTKQNGFTRLRHLKKKYLKQKLEKKINDVNSFINSINNIKEMIIYFKDENYKSREKYEKEKMLITLLKFFDTIDVIART